MLPCHEQEREGEEERMRHAALRKLGLRGDSRPKNWRTDVTIYGNRTRAINSIYGIASILLRLSSTAGVLKKIY